MKKHDDIFPILFVYIVLLVVLYPVCEFIQAKSELSGTIVTIVYLLLCINTLYTLVVAACVVAMKLKTK